MLLRVVGWKRLVRSDESESICRLVAIGFVVLEIRSDGDLWVEATPAGTELGGGARDGRWRHKNAARLGRYAKGEGDGPDT